MDLSSKIRIALVVPTLSNGGAERVVSILVNKWCTQNIDVHLILLAKAEKFYRIDERVEIHELGFVNPQNKVLKLFSEFRVFLKLRATLKSIEPNSVLSFMTKYNAFTLLAAIGLKTNLFVSERSNPFKKLPFTTQVLRKMTYPLSKGIIAQTEIAKIQLNQIFENINISVIPNPLREIDFYPDLKREKVILNVGRLVPEKGQKHLISTFARINNRDWKLVILGEGSLRRELEMQIQNLGISNSVFMPGSVKNVDEWLARASIFAFPSISEGFPNSLLEAMAARIPCVSFDCPVGPSELIKDGLNGYLVPVENTDLLLDKINLLINSKSKRDEISSNIDVRKYNADKISNEYLNFILQ